MTTTGTNLDSLRVSAADLKLVTSAIGMSIDGHEFELIEATYGTPGTITVYGTERSTGRKFDVTLKIVELGEVYDSDYGDF